MSSPAQTQTGAVTIVGAGPVGSLLALLLARRGRSVRLLERRADPRTHTPDAGRSINLALAARGLSALQAAGLLTPVMQQLVPMRGRLVHDERGGCSFLPYGSKPDEVIWSISRELLNRLLLDRVSEQPGIELQFQTRCLDVEPARRCLQLQVRSDAPREEPFELLLGADGAGSAVRTALVRRGRVCAHEDPLAHDYKELMIGVEAARALSGEALHIWPRGGFMLIALPNADGSFTATLFLPRVGNPGFDQLVDAAAVGAFFRQYFPDIAAAVRDHAQQFALHPQGRLGTLHCAGWQVDGCVGLLGDAAHAIVPFHGQGLNAGFEDCVLLDRLLANEPAAVALPRFEHERRPDAEAIASMALENYQEMREGVRDPRFAQRQALAAELERHFPGRFIPRYSMVMFHPEISYRQALERGARQRLLLDALLERVGGQLDSPASLSLARALLDEQAP